MSRYPIRRVFVFLLAVLAVLVVISIFTNAHDALATANPLFSMLSVAFFLLSITVWIFSWAVLIKKKRVGTWKKVVVGWGSVYGALTPMQIGAEALRSMHLKALFGVSFTESVSASMLVKGIKFLVLTILAAVLISALLFSASEPVAVAGLVSGLAVMMAAVLLFLLPLNSACGTAISRLFKKLSRKVVFLKPLESYFKQYSKFLEKTSKKMFFLTVFLAIASLVFELLALQFAFYSINFPIPIQNVVILFVLVAVLERTPVLPRGIGLVELASFTYLSLQTSGVPLAADKIGSVIILFDVARLVFPTVLSVVFYLVFLRGNEFKGKEPHRTVC